MVAPRVRGVGSACRPRPGMEETRSGTSCTRPTGTTSERRGAKLSEEFSATAGGSASLTWWCSTRRTSRGSSGCSRSKRLSGRWPSSPACLCQPVPEGQRPCLPLERAERGEGVRVAFPASGFTNTRREPGGRHGSSGRTQVANSWGESDASQRLIRKQVGRAWGQAASLLPPALPCEPLSPPVQTKSRRFRRLREAAGQGFEPQLPDPESGVLPLDDPATGRGPV
jgi:hypothetical protein